MDGWIDGRRGRNDIGPSIADQRDVEGERGRERQGESQILVPTIKDTIGEGARRQVSVQRARRKL